MKTTIYIAMSMTGYWGRGNTIAEAKRAMQQQGGRIRDGGLLFEVIQPKGKPDPYVDASGNIVHWGESPDAVDKIHSWKRSK